MTITKSNDGQLNLYNDSEKGDPIPEDGHWNAIGNTGNGITSQGDNYGSGSFSLIGDFINNTGTAIEINSFGKTLAEYNGDIINNGNGILFGSGLGLADTYTIKGNFISSGNSLQTSAYVNEIEGNFYNNQTALINTIQGAGDGIGLNWGAIGTIKNSSFINNNAIPNNLSQLKGLDNSTFQQYQEYPYFEDLLLYESGIYSGGAIGNYSKIGSIDNSFFYGNSARKGGAIYNISVNNSWAELFANNGSEYLYNDIFIKEINEIENGKITDTFYTLSFNEGTTEPISVSYIHYYPLWKYNSNIVKESVNLDEMTDEERAEYNDLKDYYIKHNAILSNKNELENIITDAIEHLQYITIQNSSFINNYAESDSEYFPAKGGAIYSSGPVRIIANNGNSVIISGNYTLNNGVKDENAIYMGSQLSYGISSDGNNLIIKVNPSTLDLISKDKSVIWIDDKINGDNYSAEINLSSGKIENETDTEHYNINISGDNTGAVVLNNDIENSPNITLEDTNLYLGRENVLDGSQFTFNSGTLSLVNNQVGTMNLDSFLLGENATMAVDVDLANAVMDRITARNYSVSDGAQLNVNYINLLSDAKTDKTDILFADNKDFAAAVNYTGANPIAYSPIYKYNVSYNKDDGYFTFLRGTSGGGSGTTIVPSGNKSDAFNPAVLASPVAAQTGATSSMQQVFNYSFQNADNFMNIPYLERVAMKNANKYALSPTGDATDVGTFSPLFTERNSNSIWVKPYASFENIPLKNGPKVSNITYGTLVGFDTAMESTKHGWDRVWTGYIGYNGASQRYSGVDSTQNGGLLGATLTMYKGNFFNATTVSTGASVASNDNMYGHENFAMLMAGIGNKTGYNVEFKDGKFIIQPNLLLSYTFVNTFDYTNAAGVRINSDPLHAIQIAPGVKFIGNFKGGWQPYVGVNMVWNLLDKSDVHANDVKLPEMSIKPYVQYGVGLQKRFKDDKCMAFGQAMIQNGGRNGISLSAGFRWALGRDGKKIDRQHEKVSLPAPKITLNGGKSAVGGNDASNQHPSSILPSTGKEGIAGWAYLPNNQEILRSAQNDDIGETHRPCHPEQPEQRMKAQAISVYCEGGVSGSKNNKSAGLLRDSFAMTEKAGNTSQTVQGERKILKQMTASQKAAFNRKYNNTTITSKSAILKQL